MCGAALSGCRRASARRAPGPENAFDPPQKLERVRVTNNANLNYTNSLVVSTSPEIYSPTVMSYRKLNLAVRIRHSPSPGAHPLDPTPAQAMIKIPLELSESPRHPASENHDVRSIISGRFARMRRWLEPKTLPAFMPTAAASLSLLDRRGETRPRRRSTVFVARLQLALYVGRNPSFMRSRALPTRSLFVIAVTLPILPGVHQFTH